MTPAAINAEIAQIRGEIAQLPTPADVTGAPVPLDDALSRLDAALPNLAEQGRASLDAARWAAGDNYDGRFVHVPRGNLLVVQHEDLAALREELLGVLAWIFPAEFRGRLLTALESFYQARAPGLPLATRAAEIAQLNERRCRLEVREERLVRAAETQGLMPERREDADPAVVLARDLDELSPSPATHKRA